MQPSPRAQTAGGLGTDVLCILVSEGGYREAGTAAVTSIAVVWTACFCIVLVRCAFYFYMSRQAPLEAPRNYGCLSHAVGGSQSSTARQRGEVVRDDDNRIGQLGCRDAGKCSVVGPVMTTVGSSWEHTRASLNLGLAARAPGEGGDAAATGETEATVWMCLVNPPRQLQPVIPA